MNELSGPAIALCHELACAGRRSAARSRKSVYAAGELRREEVRFMRSNVKALPRSGNHSEDAALRRKVVALKAELAEKDAVIANFMRTETHLVPLPNGDLHRGFRKVAPVESNIDVEVIPDSMGNPLDRAMAKVLAAAKGGHDLTCLCVVSNLVTVKNHRFVNI